MPRIDIDEVLREKAPRFAKYIPRFVRNWLRRTIHEEALNDILAAGWNRPPQEFIHVAFERMRIAYRIDGLERLDPAERYLFVANHPFGGLDGMMIADALIERYAQRFGTPLYEIGRIIESSGIRWKENGRAIRPRWQGFRHF